jgi:hypothetical protein
LFEHFTISSDQTSILLFWQLGKIFLVGIGSTSPFYQALEVVCFLLVFDIPPSRNASLRTSTLAERLAEAREALVWQVLAWA